MEPPQIDAETQQKIQHIQILEQSFQQLLMQKQAFSLELNETNFALEELKKAKGDVFRIVGNQIVIKSTKEDLEKEMNNKKGLINLRLKNIDKQEKEFSEKIQEMKKEIIEKIQNQSSKEEDKEKKK